MGFGVQLYSVRDALADDLPGALGRLAEMGFSAVEAYDITSFEGRLPHALRENGLTAPTVHAHLLGDDVDAVLEAAAQLGAHGLSAAF